MKKLGVYCENALVTFVTFQTESTLTKHFIRYTLLVKGWDPFYLQSCLKSS